MVKIGCGTVLFRRFSLERALSAIREAGFLYFETQAVGPWCPHVNVYQDDPESLVRLQKKYGFEGITGLWALDGSLISNEKCVESGIRSIEWAAAAGIPIVHLGDGFRPETMSDDEAFGRIADRLAALAEAARKNGVRLAIEPHGTYSLTCAGLLKILSAADRDVLGVNYDAANIFRACFVDTGNAGAHWQKIENHENEVEVLEAVSDRVIHMHAKDLDRNRRCVAVGDGLVDVESCVKLLTARGYDGVISVETEGDNSFEESVEIAGKSCRALKRMTAQE